MRKQYFFRASDRGLLAWDVHRLVELSRNFPRETVSLDTLRTLDEPWAGEDELPTWRTMVEHMRLIQEADLSFPIILSASGEVMDGRHRIAKAALENRMHITAVRFAVDPEPDHVGVRPDELSYESSTGG
jgi:hypothetical protein